MRRRNYSELYILLLFAALLVLCATFAHSQVPVAMAPPIHFQFFNSSGVPLANGKIFTYAAGTTTFQNTYVDSTGTTTNPDPIPLDSTGSPSNGSVETGIFLSNLSWKFVAYDVNNVFQWSADNVTTYFALLNTVNTWTASQTFSLPITDLATDNQILLGALLSQTTLDFPPPLSNIVLHFPNTADTMVGRATTDTLSNKTFSDIPKMDGTLTPELVLYKNTTQTTHTGDTSTDTIYTATIPILSTTASLRVTLGFSVTTQGAGSTIVHVTLGTQVFDAISVSSGSVQCQAKDLISNTGSVSSQTDSYFEGCATSMAIGASSGAVNTGASTTLTVTATNANNSDSQTFNQLLVELF